MKEEKYLNISVKINQTLENMCIYGNIIKEEKEKNPEKFISKVEALKLEERDNELFSLGLIADILEELGIEILIEKDESEINEDEETTILQYLSNGFLTKKKYILIFDFGEKKNEKLLKNKKEYEKFKNNLKNKISNSIRNNYSNLSSKRKFFCTSNISK